MGPKGVPNFKTDRPTDHRLQHQLNSIQQMLTVAIGGGGGGTWGSNNAGQIFVNMLVLEIKYN
jgi:hypothetical protein